MVLSALHLFAGAGGGILSDLLLGHRTVGAVEIEEYPRRVLLERQSDGCLPPFPIWDDVQTFRLDNPDTRSYIEWLIERRDYLVIAGGFPCQDVSVAGKGAGITGERSGLWKEFARIIGEIRPRYAFIENSPMLTLRGLDVVLADLAALGMDAVWTVVSAADAGAPHRRERIWILAHHPGDGRRTGRTGRLDSGDTGQSEPSLQDVANANSEQFRATGHRCPPGAARSAEGGEEKRQRVRTDAGQCSTHCGEVAHTPRTGRPAGGPASGHGPHGQICDVQPADGGCAIPDTDRLRQLQPQGRERDQRGWAGDGGCQIRDSASQGLSHGSAKPIHRSRQDAEPQRSDWRTAQSGVGRLADELPPQLVPGWWDIEPDVGRLATGVKNRVGQLKALGNGQVPLQAALAWRILSDAISR